MQYSLYRCWICVVSFIFFYWEDAHLNCIVDDKLLLRLFHLRTSGNQWPAFTSTEWHTDCQSIVELIATRIRNCRNLIISMLLFLIHSVSLERFGNSDSHLSLLIAISNQMMKLFSKVIAYCLIRNRLSDTAAFARCKLNTKAKCKGKRISELSPAYRPRHVHLTKVVDWQLLLQFLASNHRHTYVIGVVVTPSMPVGHWPITDRFRFIHARVGLRHGVARVLQVCTGQVIVLLQWNTWCQVRGIHVNRPQAKWHRLIQRLVLHRSWHCQSVGLSVIWVIAIRRQPDGMNCEF